MQELTCRATCAPGKTSTLSAPKHVSIAPHNGRAATIHAGVASANSSSSTTNEARPGPIAGP
eukprot:1329793-Rhodomonas_salina.2